jgi:hypothetical protein
MRPASQISDRAKRYRAHRNPPPGPRICNFCADDRSIDIDHISGNEADDEDDNKMWLCRSCNTSKGVQQARARVGLRTVQFNPQKSAPAFSEFRTAAAILTGKAPGNVARATEVIRSTSPARRRQFAQRIARQRRNPAPTFEQYVHAVIGHQRGAHDEGGKVIHATPPALRSQYAREIASVKRQRGTGRRAAPEEVPF